MLMCVCGCAEYAAGGARLDVDAQHGAARGGRAERAARHLAEAESKTRGRAALVLQLLLSRATRLQPRAGAAAQVQHVAATWHHAVLVLQLLQTGTHAHM